MEMNLHSLKMRPRPGVGVIYCGLESRVVPRPGTKGPPSRPHAVRTWLGHGWYNGLELEVPTARYRSCAGSTPLARY